MSGEITEDELLAVLQDIDAGKVTLNAEDIADALDGYCGDFRFRASNGWEFVIFNDCGEWDYIDEAKTPDGRTIDFDAIWERMPRIKAFLPQGNAWGIGE